MGGYGSGQSPNSKKNLKAQKGRVPSVFNALKELRGQLATVCPHDPQERIWGEVLIEKALWMACYNGNGQGSITAVSEILDRLLGKPAQTMSLDANITQTTTEQVQDILQSLSILKAAENNGDDNPEPGSGRVN